MQVKEGHLQQWPPPLAYSQMQLTKSCLPMVTWLTHTNTLCQEKDKDAQTSVMAYTSPLMLDKT